MFFLGVYKDQQRAVYTIAAIRHYYPDEKILTISDGIRNDSYGSYCERVGADYRIGQRLKTPDWRGEWTVRFLRAFLETEDDHVIKIDPDTIITSKADLPAAPVYAARNMGNLSGAAIGFSREAAEEIVESRLMFDEKYETGPYTYHRFYPPRLKEGEVESTELVSLQDAITTDVVNRLNIPALEWDAVSLTDSKAPFYHE